MTLPQEVWGRVSTEKPPDLRYQEVSSANRVSRQEIKLYKCQEWLSWFSWEKAEKLGANFPANPLSAARIRLCLPPENTRELPRPRTGTRNRNICAGNIQNIHLLPSPTTQTRTHTRQTAVTGETSLLAACDRRQVNGGGWETIFSVSEWAAWRGFKLWEKRGYPHWLKSTSRPATPTQTHTL